MLTKVTKITRIEHFYKYKKNLIRPKIFNGFCVIEFVVQVNLITQVFCLEVNYFGKYFFKGLFLFALITVFF